jgi:sporulation protein YlmC with PRC-barrel domain
MEQRREREKERPDLEIIGETPEQEQQRLARRHAAVMGASTLTGDPVVNAEGETLGTIHEIMLHVPTGRIAYAVLSFGGALGGLLGTGKLFAIPWQSLHLDPEHHRFVLNVPKEKLEHAPGFDKDNWPDMADPNFGRSIYDYYGIKSDWQI